MFRLLTIVALIALINAGYCIHKIPMYSTHAFDQSSTENCFTTDSGVVMDPRYDYFNAQLFGFIHIGIPMQEFKVLFDTASLHVWVPSKSCKYDDVACSLHNKYDSKNSDTYIRNNTRYVITYDIGNVLSYISTDRMNFAGLNIRDQSFLETTILPATFITAKFDGILGLGTYRPIYDVAPTPFFDNLIEQGLLKPRHVFSIYLNRDPSSAIGGQLILGDSDRAYYYGGFTYINTTYEGRWTITIDRIQIAPDITVCADCQGIIATGTSHISGPLSYIAIINREIRKAYGLNKTLIMNCDEVTNLPSINFIISGKRFTLTADDYIFKRKKHDMTTCISGFKPGGNTWYLGNIFFHQYYTEFDIENSRIGFAIAKKWVY